MVPPDNFQISQLSMVPMQTCCVVAECFSSHASFVGGKRGSIGRPVRAIMSASCPAALSASHSFAVRRHCHVITGPSGLPVFLSQIRTDSRWLDMPIAESFMLDFSLRHSKIATCVASHIASASC